MATTGNRRAAVDPDGSLIMWFLRAEPDVKDELKATWPRAIEWDRDRRVWRLPPLYLRTAADLERAQHFLANRGFVASPDVGRLLNPPPPPPLPDSVIKATRPVHHRLSASGARYYVEQLPKQSRDLQRLADAVVFLGWRYQEGQEHSDSVIGVHAHPRFDCDGVVVELYYNDADAVLACRHCGEESIGSCMYPRFERVNISDFTTKRPFTSALDVPRACARCHYSGPPTPRLGERLRRFLGRPAQ